MKNNSKTSLNNFSKNEQNGVQPIDIKKYPLISPSDISVHLGTTLKDRVKVLLGRLGRSQNWLADQVGISIGSMSKIVNGDWFPASQTMVKIAEVLDCDSIALFGDSEYWKHWSNKMIYGEKHD